MSRFAPLLLAIALLCALVLPARAQDPAPAVEVANKFYRWYFKQGDHFWDHLSQVRPLFDSTLYKRLTAWYKSGTVDFDPFVNAQMNGTAYSLGKNVTFQGGFAVVPVTITIAHSKTKTKFKMVLHRVVDHYEIWNFIYDEGFDLRTTLEKRK